MFQTPRTRSNAAPKRVPSVAEIDEIAQGQQVGITLHDNPNDKMSGGWAFLRDEAPFKFRGFYDLPTTALWISSIERKVWTAHRDTAMLNNVKSSEFLGISLTKIGRDLGIRLDGALAYHAGSKLVPHVQAAVRLAIAMYGMSEPNIQLQQDTLTRVIQRLIPTPPPTPDVVSVLTLMSAHQSYSSPQTPWTDNHIQVNLRYSRVPYANYLLSQRFPDLGWRLFIPTDADLELMQGDDSPPALIEGTIEFDQTPEEVANLIAFGTGPKQNVNATRRWMTDVEYRWISRHAHVHVTKALICTEAQTLLESFRLPPRMVLEPALYQTVSFGLLASAHWMALAETRWNKDVKRAEPDLIGTWITAYDREKCFVAAYHLAQQGFSVRGYGKGAVNVVVRRERLPELAELAQGLNLIWPTWSALMEEYGYGSESAEAA